MISKILFALLLSFISVYGYAQDEAAKTWYIADYTGNAAISIQGNVAKVQKGNDAIEFKVEHRDDVVYLADKSKEQEILSLLGVDNAMINRRYPGKISYLSIEKLLTQVDQLQGKKLLIKKGEETSSVLSGNDNNGEDTSGIENAESSSEVISPGNNWMLPAAIGLAALLAGLLIGRAIRPGKKQDNVVAVEQGETVVSGNENNKVLREKLTKLNHANKEFKAFEEHYFGAIFDKIVLPLQQAIDSGDREAMLRYMTIASSHLSSLTRSKLKKKLRYDEANVKLILNDKGDAQSYPVISRDTPTDQIPANLRTLMELLKQHGITGLDETIVQGYRIQNI